jgi:hypothetical protein
MHRRELVRPFLEPIKEFVLKGHVTRPPTRKVLSKLERQIDDLPP